MRRGDAAPDIDQSYACPCEAAHSTFTRTVAVTGLHTAAGSTGTGGSSGGAGQPAQGTGAASALPDTGGGVSGGAVSLLGVAATAAVALLGRRTRRPATPG